MDSPARGDSQAVDFCPARRGPRGEFTPKTEKRQLNRDYRFGHWRGTRSTLGQALTNSPISGSSRKTHFGDRLVSSPESSRMDSKFTSPNGRGFHYVNIGWLHFGRSGNYWIPRGQSFLHGGLSVLLS